VRVSWIRSGFRPHLFAALVFTLTSSVASSGEGVWTSHGPSPFHGELAFVPEFPAVAVDAFDPRVVFAASLESGDRLEVRSGFVFKGYDRGEIWNLLAKAPPATRVSALVSDPAVRDSVYGLLQTGRLYRSRNGGVSWEATAAFAAPANGMRFDPGDSATLYVYGSSLWRRDAGAARWRDLRVPYRPVTAFDLDRADGEVLYAGTGIGLMKSADAGASWVRVDEGIAPDCPAISAVAADPGPDGTVLAAYYKLLLPTRPFDGWCAAAFRSPDGGSSWESIHGLPVPVSCFVFDPIDGSTVYAAAGGSVLRSADGGTTWEQMSNGLSGYAGQLVIDESGTQLYVATSRGVFAYEVPDADSRVVHRHWARPSAPRSVDDRH
jgi:photosystem II stability/assembly factor-like uncharacterized protein